MNALKRERWSPYLVGAGIGVLSWVTFGLMGKALGASTTFVRLIGMLEGVFAPEHVQANAYFTKYIIDNAGRRFWQMMLVTRFADRGTHLGAAQQVVSPGDGSRVCGRVDSAPADGDDLRPRLSVES